MTRGPMLPGLDPVAAAAAEYDRRAAERRHGDEGAAGTPAPKRDGLFHGVAIRVVAGFVGAILLAGAGWVRGVSDASDSVAAMAPKVTAIEARAAAAEAKAEAAERKAERIEVTTTAELKTISARLGDIARAVERIEDRTR